MRVYLTGGRGYLGSYLTHYLKLRNIHVCLNNCNLVDYNALLYEIKRFKPHIIIHLAGIHDCDIKHIALRNNTLLLKNILKVMKMSSCNKLIYASTQQVYGTTTSAAEETDTLLPYNTYGITKLLGEHIIANSDINAIIFRMCTIAGFNLFGDNNDNIFNYLIHRSINKNSKGNIITEINNSSYVSIDDVCAAYYLALLKLYNDILIGQHIFNLATDHTHTISNILQYFNQAIQEKNKQDIIYHKVPYIHNNDRTTIIMDNRKIKNILSWTPYHDIYDIIISYLV